MQTPRNGRTTLIGEDEPEVRGYLEMALKCMGYAVESAQDGDEVLSCLQSSRSEICLVLLDVMMPNRDGLDALKEIRRIDPSLPVIVMSGASSTVNVVTAMKCGATDFLCKPLVHEELQRAVSRAVDLKPAESVRPLRNTTPGTQAFIGSTQSMKEIQGLLGPIGWSDAPVLIQGETGSGKEVIARELHAQSPRAKKAFLKVNCAALPSELVESELFGYERERLRAPSRKRPACSKLPMAEPSCWMKSATWTYDSRPSCFRFCRIRNFKESAARKPSRWTSGFWRLLTKTWKKPLWIAGFAKTSTTG